MTVYTLVVRLLVTLIVSVLGLEFGLRTLDPMGILEYQYDMWVIFRAIYKPADGRPFVMPDGKETLRRWSYTVRDGIRVTPNAEGATCRIVTLGDSVTWGFGVNDNETWPALLAKHFKKVEVVNVAQNGYNIWDNLAALQAFPANGYVYMIIGNDNEPTFQVPLPGIAPEGSAITTYLAYLNARAKGGRMESFRRALAGLQRRSDVLLFSFAEYNYPVQGIVRRSDLRNSPYDGHPNAAGYEDIFRQMLPVLSEFIGRRCP